MFIMKDTHTHTTKDDDDKEKKVIRIDANAKTASKSRIAQYANLDFKRKIHSHKKKYLNKYYHRTLNSAALL